MGRMSLSTLNWLTTGIQKVLLCGGQRTLLSTGFYCVAIRPVWILTPDSSVDRALTGDSGGQGSNLSFVCHYFSHPVAFGAVPTPGTDRLTPWQTKPRPPESLVRYSTNWAISNLPDRHTSPLSPLKWSSSLKINQGFSPGTLFLPSSCSYNCAEYVR